MYGYWGKKKKKNRSVESGEVTASFGGASISMEGDVPMAFFGP